MNKNLFTVILIGLSFFLSCKKAKEAVLDYYISSSDSKNKVVVEGMIQFLNDPNSAKTGLEIKDLVASNSSLTFNLINELTYDLKFNLDNITGTFNVSPELNNVSMPYASGSTRITSGKITVSNLTVKPLDKSRGRITFRISGDVVVDMVTQTQTLRFDFTANFNNESDDPYKPPTNPPPGGGGNTGDCKNTISILGAVSYYSYMNVGNVAAESITNVKCIKTTADNGVPAFVISGDYNRSQYPLKYQVQIIVPQAQIKAGNTIKFNASQGIIGILVSIDAPSNSPTDSWRTNRDYGKNRDMGTLTIVSVAPKIQGTYEFEASGDGYPSLNQQYAKTKGTFCVDP